MKFQNRVKLPQITVFKKKNKSYWFQYENQEPFNIEILPKDTVKETLFKISDKLGMSPSSKLSLTTWFGVKLDMNEKLSLYSASHGTRQQPFKVKIQPSTEQLQIDMLKEAIEELNMKFERIPPYQKHSEYEMVRVQQNEQEE